MLTHWTHWLVLIQIVAIFTLVLGILCQKFSWLQFPSGFLIFGVSLLTLTILGLVGILLLALSFIGNFSIWRMPATIALVVGLAPVVVIISSVGMDKLRAPVIHDISTDLNLNLNFTAALSDRANSDNSLSSDAKVMDIQQKAYPHIQPLMLSLSPDEAFAKSLALVNKRQWAILREDKNLGEIEAVAESALFGFKDDVIIRISADQGGSRIDMRSASRVGRSDLGANQQRISRFFEDLK